MSRVKTYLISLIMIAVAASCAWVPFSFEVFGRISAIVLLILTVLAVVAFREALRNFPGGDGP